MNDLKSIKVIAFDADDTLWDNEPFFRKAEENCFDLLRQFIKKKDFENELLRIEIQNLSLYGYGIKSFMLSMIETAIKVSGQKSSIEVLSQILLIGKQMLDEPVVLLPGVVHVLESLQSRFKIVLATKGDLLDQERKLKKSGLSTYFHHIEIMSDKDVLNYQNLIKHLDIEAKDFLMIGNSLKSDILPVLEIGSHAIHIPYHTTWIHEHVDVIIENPKFKVSNSLNGILNWL